MRSPVADGHEAASPELALVDPALRRLLLHELQYETPRWAVSPTPRVEVVELPRRPSWKSHVLAAAAAAAVTAAVVITPGGAAPDLQRVPGPRVAEQPANRTFAWVATPGATGYRFALFRGDALVYESTTRRPQLALPGTWRLGASSESLRPGRYRWYVWPVRSSDAVPGTGRAVVQATLEVPG